MKFKLVLTAVEGELRKVQGELQVAQNDLIETRDGMQLS